VTSPSGSIAVTSAPVTIRAPAADATRVSSVVSAPIPPTGTSQSPVPLPMTWYRKHLFWRSSGSSVGANVPMSASVATMPRTVSSAKLDSITSLSGRSNSASHARASPTAFRSCSLPGSGPVRVGKTRPATEPVIA
jgi:hypothetical protein